MEAYKVSVIIPTHNRNDLVVRAIKSVQDQTYSNLEIIIVSDGSTDGTSDVVKDILKIDNRVFFYEYENAMGANHARNYGARNATGEYIAFLDDDDAWQTDKLENQMLVFDGDENIGLVTTGFRFIYVFNNSETNYVPTPKYDSHIEILMKNVIGGTPAVVMRKDIFDEIGGFDEQLHALQDYDLWIRAAQITKIGVFSRPSVDVYDYSDVAKISNNTGRYVEAYEHIENKYQSLIQNLSKTDNDIRKYNFSMLLAKKGLRNADKKLARKYAKNAIKVKFSLSALSIFFLSLIPYGVVLKIKNKVKK